MDEAREYFKRSLTIAYNRGVQKELAYNQLWIASLAHADGRLEEATESAESALKIFNKIGDVRGAEQADACLRGLASPWKKPGLKRFAGIEK